MNGGQPENQSYKQTFSDFGQHPFNLIAIIDYCKLKYWWGLKLNLAFVVPHCLAHLPCHIIWHKQTNKFKTPHWEFSLKNNTLQWFANNSCNALRKGFKLRGWYMAVQLLIYSFSHWNWCGQCSVSNNVHRILPTIKKTIPVVSF